MWYVNVYMKSIKSIVWMVSLMVLALAGSNAVHAQKLNDKLLNRPYTDQRRWHLGFSVGLHTQDLKFQHNDFVTENGETWFMEQPSFSPGFCVNGLIDFRLNDYFNLRFTPGMYFGNRDVRMLDTTYGGTLRQNLKTAYVVLPVDLKFSAQRFRNARPYLVGGVMPAVDVTKQRAEFIKLKPMDVYLTVGFGCDFYLPFFKLNPEIKFCFGMMDALEHNRPDLTDEPEKLKITQSLQRLRSQMVVLTFYFE